MYALGLLLAIPAFAADPGKSAASQNVGGLPAVQSDAVSNISAPKAVAPPPVALPPAPRSSVSGGPGMPGEPAPKVIAPTVSAPPKVATPGLPTGGGLPGIDHKADAIRDANVELGRIRDMKQLEDLYKSPMNRGRDGAGLLNPPQGLPGAGTASAGLRPWERAGSNMGNPNCRSNPAECLRRGAQTGGMGQAPTVGSGVPDNRGVAGYGPGFRNYEERTSRQNRISNSLGDPIAPSSSDGTTVTTRHENGTHRETVERDRKGWLFITDSDNTSSGDTSRSEYQYDETGQLRTEVHTITDGNGNGSVQITRYDEHGNVLSEAIRPVNRRNPPAPPAQETPGGTAGGEGDPDSTPSETSQQAKGADNCNWNPVWGRCMNKQKPSHKDMTSQPSQGGDTSVGSAGHRIGSEAVTNGGGGDWQVSTGGGSSGSGHPYDPRDPGHPTPGSDAALDAALGALPTPP